ncbi:hypothetical protein BGW36DRAFT_58500 [Talaromyces proteolyticus]|uniref:Glutaredoxin domain-containing protein n=1 Tax=Talaromyces proteolyticus TaxID=1131652 RepID=A0AAD4KL62_9EURO|nr:uncharacterized protein BGW36DRAFT_58500 [Talaromyces proteolyticus]KAH8690661.1 hypothetical protein BGW36DRAFT_58500 [Talaromyces proteolyticus]
MAASDSTLYLYTSLTAGSSHIITATSRLETILKANKIPFRAIDVATDDAARRLWGRYSKGRKLPGLVKYRTIIGDLEQIEEWNEYGELKMEIGAVTDPDDFSADNKPSSEKAEPVFAPKTAPPAAPINTTSSTPTPKSASPHIQIQNPPVTETKDDPRTLALRLAGEEAAARAKQNALTKLGTKPATTEGDGKAVPASNPKAKGTESAEDKTNPEESQLRASKEDLPKKIPSAASAALDREQTSSPSTSAEGRRRSVAPEIIPPLKRPSLADECAAVSSANFHAENAEALGLIDHHRGSIISATTQDEQDQVRKDIRASITEAPDDGDIQALRKVAAEKKDETIEEEEEEIAAAQSDKGEEAKDEKEIKTDNAPEATAASEEEEKDTQKQDPKDATKTAVSVED